METITLEVRTDGNLYDANGLMLVASGLNLVSVAPEVKYTLELIKLGVSPKDVIKLKRAQCTF